MNKLICDFCKYDADSLLKFTFIGYTHWMGTAYPTIDVEMCGNCYIQLRKFLKEELPR